MALYGGRVGTMGQCCVGAGGEKPPLSQCMATLRHAGLGYCCNIDQITSTYTYMYPSDSPWGRLDSGCFRETQRTDCLIVHSMYR